MTEGIIIQCRDNSTRMKHKSVIPFYKNKSILEIIIDKFKYLKCQTIVATTIRSQKTIDICKKLNIPWYIDSEYNVAKRIYRTAKYYQLHGFFRVCADNPFIQLSFLQILSNWIEDGYDYIAFKDGMQRHEGFFVEYIKRSALLDVLEDTDLIYDLQHVTPYIIRHPELFKQAIIPLPKIMKDWYLHLTVDTIEGFKIAQEVYYALGATSWTSIYEYMKNRYDLQKRMYHEIMRNRKDE